MSNPTYFEVIARYSHGTRAEVIKAETAAQALTAGKRIVSRMIPDGYRPLQWTVRAFV